MRREVLIIVWLVNLIGLCYPFNIYPQAQERSNSQSSTSNKVMSAEEVLEVLGKASDILDFAKRNAAFTCPFYLLRLSDNLYGKKDALGIRIEELVRAVEAAKRIAEIVKKEIFASSETYIPSNSYYFVYEEVLLYLDALSKTAVAQKQYFEAPDTKNREALNKCYSEIAKHSAAIERILENPFASNEKALDIARVDCPRWLITLSDGIYGDRTWRGKKEKKWLICTECAEVASTAKIISELFAKETLSFSDAVLKDKFLRYVKAIIAEADAYTIYFQTGDIEKMATVQYSGDDALSCMKEIEEYLASKR